MERFFLSLKVERLNRHRYATQAQAQRDIQDYIENFYNTQRLHSALGYLTPAHYEAGLKANTPKTVSTKTCPRQTARPPALNGFAHDGA